MLIIIDGYNLLKTITGTRRSSESKKRALVAELIAYSQKKEHQICVVFDGGFTNMPAHERQKNMDVVYAGYRQTADDYIKDYLDKHKQKELLLVSSDNELIGYAHNSDVVSIAAGSFAKILQNSVEKKVQSLKSQAYKTTNTSNAVLDLIMQESSSDISYKDENDTGSVRDKGFARTLKKHEKKLLRIIKKL